MSDNPHIFEVTTQTFQSDVLEKSQEVPVLIDVWADWCQPCKAQLPILEKLAAEYQGKFVVAKIDADREPALAQHLGVRSLPSLKLIFQGQLVNDFTGLQQESELRKVLDEVTMSPADRIKLQVDQLVEAGEIQQALDLLQQLLQQEPNNHSLRVMMTNILLRQGRIDDAKQVMATIPEDTPGIAQPKAKLGFYELAAELPKRGELEELLSKDQDNLSLIYQLAIHQVLDDEFESALTALMAILRKDKQFDEGAAQKLMIQVFDLLGAGSPIAKQFRRQLFSFLH
ncbi:tetratricopeptide repeat protein [Spartinivicinus poritis]|uniref:Tetratricopeptide repeat protein n=1 Tax=Spartinivicinus poritis TaxID=2994640 RepID=A0ABT5U7H8_9GAMM|nr:tetratricopeptide repeat protein [Spartinivicinus sp. A2-2]MDE1462336.1 tetratricopeptide repeat protein [Spartinivicinus sp. A2-2]